MLFSCTKTTLLSLKFKPKKSIVKNVNITEIDEKIIVLRND